MRIVICCTLLFVCLAIVPSVQCDRKYKVSEFDERDKRDTRERYNKRNNDDYDDAPRSRKNRYRSESDEDFSESKSDRVRRLKRTTYDDEKPQRTRNLRANDEERTKKFRVKVQSESEEDYTDETDESISDACVDKKGRRCDSDDTDETNEDSTDEDESDIPKKRVIYIKKFAHEKKKPKQDKETGNILKIHRRAGLGRKAYDAYSSEEVHAPKRRRFIYDDDDE